MNDQATTLRRMSAFALKQMPIPNTIPDIHHATTPAPKVRTIAVASGKGGVGKSNVAVNLALELSALGRKVSLLDADLGLANADVLLGFNPKFHLGHVLTGQRRLEEVVIELENGVRLIPGGSGIEQLANLSPESHSRYVHELHALEAASDFLIVDTAAGIAGNVTGVLKAASEIIIVTTPEPTSVVDAYATIKVVHQHAPHKLIWVAVNNATGTGDAQQAFKQLYTAAQRFLPHYIRYLGTIPHDPELETAVRERVPVVEHAPQAPASRAFRILARTLDRTVAHTSDNPAHSFWEVLTEVTV